MSRLPSSLLAALGSCAITSLTYKQHAWDRVDGLQQMQVGPQIQARPQAQAFGSCTVMHAHIMRLQTVQMTVGYVMQLMRLRCEAGDIHANYACLQTQGFPLFICFLCVSAAHARILKEVLEPSLTETATHPTVLTCSATT